MTFLVGMVCGCVLMPEWIGGAPRLLQFGAGSAKYEFPMRVPIYFKNKKYLISTTGERVYATFWGPFDKTQEPYIRIAVDDYEDILESFGKDRCSCRNTWINGS